MARKKPEKPQANIMWGLYDWRGWLHEVYPTRKSALKHAERHWTEDWDVMYRDGWRCIKIKITPVAATPGVEAA